MAFPCQPADAVWGGGQSYEESIEVSPVKGPVEKGDENSESGPD